MNPQETFFSSCQLQFVRQALDNKGLRVDGRKLLESRAVAIQLLDNHTSEARLGETRVTCRVTAEKTEPRSDRPSEGFYAFECSASPMASKAFGASGYGETSVSLGHIVERSLKESRAIEAESLCVLSGVEVWRVTVHLHVLDARGNLADCCSLAAVAALRHFHLPGDTPLTVHHTPVVITMGVMDSGELVADASAEEELVLASCVSIAMNQHQELCLVHKGGGTGVPVDVLLRCISVAREKSQLLIQAVDTALRKAKGLHRAGADSRPSLIAYLEAPVANSEPAGLFASVMDEDDDDEALAATSRPSAFVWNEEDEEEEREEEGHGEQFAAVAKDEKPSPAIPQPKREKVVLEEVDSLADAVIKKTKKKKKKRKQKK